MTSNNDQIFMYFWQILFKSFDYFAKSYIFLWLFLNDSVYILDETPYISLSNI